MVYNVTGSLTRWSYRLVRLRATGAYTSLVPAANDDDGRINGLFEMKIQADKAGYSVSDVRMAQEHTAYSPARSIR